MKKIIVTLLSVIVLACSKEDDNSIDTNQTFLEKYDGVIIKNTPFTDFTKFENIPSGEFMFTYEIDQASPETLVYYFSTNIYSYYGVGNRPFKCILNINEENHLNFDMYYPDLYPPDEAIYYSDTPYYTFDIVVNSSNVFTEVIKDEYTTLYTSQYSISDQNALNDFLSDRIDASR